MAPRTQSKRCCVHGRRPRRGAAAVEFALVAPVFLLLLAGIIEFGSAFRIQHAVSNAARRGARTAIFEGATTNQVVDKVKAQCLEALGVAPSDVLVVVAINGSQGGDVATAESSDEISVTVGVPYSKAAVGFFAHLFTNRVVSATCTMERE